MPKDYAKKKSPAKKRRGASRSHNKSPTIPMSLWLFTVTLVVILASGLSYLKWFKPATPITKKIPNKINTSKDKSFTNKTVEDQVPFYDVHEDLTNKKVIIPKEDLKLPDNYKKYYYTMPCGSFREQTRAEELKARIAMVGNKSELKNIVSKGETWYRIQLGPFNSKRTAEKIRHSLQDNGIHDCVLNAHLKAN